MASAMLIGCSDPRVLETILQLLRRYDPGDGIFGLLRFGAARDIADHRTRPAALDALEVGLLDAELIVLVEHDGARTGPDGTKAEPGCAEYAFRYGGANRELAAGLEDELHGSTLVISVRELRERLWQLYREGLRRTSPENVRFVTLVDHHADGVEEVDVAEIARRLGISTGRCD